ncbi:hypothetical protein L202_01481 [Cryptococcus amylolentus CBS 6039]|uniref:Uncharacterized protein n=1 Tax=Cryptococcus amylolentus CBS 6039 TaxID=1295533 RepID=A0A1E3I3W1_9TREE|nr:hypothetical protein L202_01481 [Cryptococcus amylolentus CBS 6039]ODN83314.1 hypothetical protein L202_01481 [Cryptococcus amylolentus CBS 6039]
MTSSPPFDEDRPRNNPHPAHSFTDLPESSNAVAGPSSHASYPAPPAPDADYFGHPPRAIDIPAYSPMDVQPNAIAGPSSEGALPRRRESDAPPMSPSSAPPVPSAVAVMHPSRFIHTHHPRRASLIPLGMNVISPVAPEHLRERESINPARNVGFQPNYTLDVYNALQASPDASRRDSVVSTTSTLTLSRPASRPPQQQATHPFYPPNWSSDRRRSSLTPSISAVAPPSPTRAVASGRSSRPLTSESAQSKTDGRDTASGFLYSAAKGDYHARRGSLPHMGHRNWAGPSQRSWNPTLPPSRGSVDHEDTLPSADFKFGSGPSPAPFSPFAGSPRGKEPKKQEDMSVFEQAEVEEAERQRRAFMAATYGADGQRARDRLSFGGQSGYSSGYSSTDGAGGLRRQSLMMWERMGLFRGSGDESAVSAPIGPTHSTHLMETSINDDDLGPRRGSLPVAIPGGVSRNGSRREARVVDLDLSTPEGDDKEEEEEEARENIGEVVPIPKRPLPPLLPLSDPGPRLLPSTLALHRANHLLNARNLQSDPLPPPLPPSLHPPDPVDVTEFDIDFILAGSSAQLGGQPIGANDSVDGHGGPAGFGELSALPAGTFQLGREEEDTFAKFVGQFDDEYGDRRGEWTFRSCRHGSTSTAHPSHDPLDTSDPAREPKAEWESSGAGKYELFANGEVRSIVTGRTWRVQKIGSREYELEDVKPWTGGLQPTVEKGERFSLAGKNVHRDQGGVKLPYFSVGTFLPDAPSRPSPLHKSSGAAGKLRASMSEAIPQVRSRATGGRSDSEASSATFSGLSQSLSNGPKPHKEGDRTRALRDDILFGSGPGNTGSKKPHRDASKESESAEKKDRSLSGVLKRGLSNLKNSSLVSSEERRLAKEERDREREKVQAHSWSGSSSSSGHHGWSPHSHQARDAVKDNRMSAGNLDHQSHLNGKTIWEEEQSDRVRWHAGKGWDGVPDDAVAMIIPLHGEASVPGTPTSPAPLLPHQFPSGLPKGIPSGIKLGDHVVPHPFFSSGTKRALLVWYVPFNSEHGDEPRPSTASSISSSTTGGHSVTNETPLSGSLPKFQKLLRRKASRDGFKRDHSLGPGQADGVPNANSTAPGKDSKRSGTLGQPLPFRSFRVVARVVNCKEMRSDVEGQEGPTSFEPVEWSGNGGSSSRPSTDALQFAPNETPPDAAIAPFLSLDSPPSEDGVVVESPALPSGRSFPTVIAVCHSRSQGVEFVLEGLDRLGLCKGESAWGPTGYEEWRGTGLSEHGRELVDLLWAGCTAVMGLMGV